MLPDEPQSFHPPHTGDWTCYHNTTAGDLVNTDTTDNVCYHRHQSQHQCHQCGSRVCFNKTILSLHNWASSNFWMIVQGPEMNQSDIWHSGFTLNSPTRIAEWMADGTSNPQLWLAKILWSFHAIGGLQLTTASWWLPSTSIRFH